MVERTKGLGRGSVKYISRWYIKNEDNYFLMKSLLVVLSQFWKIAGLLDFAPSISRLPDGVVFLLAKHE